MGPCNFNFKRLLFYRIDQPASNAQHNPMLSTTLVQRGKDLLVGVGLRLGRARQLPRCRRGSVIICDAVGEVGGAALHLGEAFHVESTTSAQGGGTKTSDTSTAGCGLWFGVSVWLSSKQTGNLTWCDSGSATGC